MDPRDLMALEEMAAGRGSIDQHVIARATLTAHRQLEKLAARVTELENKTTDPVAPTTVPAPQAQ